MPSNSIANRPASIAFITMGCAKNEVDTANMIEKLVKAGFAIQDDPESADVVVVNTCSFIQAATEESIDAVLEVAGYDSISAGTSKLIVSGCMPARYGEELKAELPEASSFVPCSKEDDIVEVVSNIIDASLLPLKTEIRCDSAHNFASLESPHVFGASSYVKISDGCDRFCSYCAIPYIRGRYHSFEYDQIRNDVANRINAGAREIILIAQDTGRWGDDFVEKKTLAWLMGQLAEEFAQAWFRVMYIQPEGVTDELINVVAQHENICSYFDIPFQHANAELLRLMNRTGSAEEHIALIKKIRTSIPAATIRTTLIAGFPGETEDQFQELLDFVADSDLDYIGSFAYSREEGTRAYSLPNQIDEDEKADRAQQLRDLCDNVCIPRVANRVGQNAEVLICGYEEDGQLFGRTRSQAPEVDGVTYLPEGAGNIGDVVEVVIDDTLLYEMEGSLV